MIFTNRLLFFLLIAISLHYGSARSSDPIPAAAQTQPMALVGATIHTVSGATLQDGVMIFDRGVITGLGKALAIPAGTETIDARGLHVYPGIIDAHTVLGLTEIGAVRETVDISEKGDINPHIRVEVALNAESEIIPVTRANGITHAVTSPRGGLICGTSAFIRLDGWTWEDMTLQAPLGLCIEWPRMTISDSPWIRMSAEEQRRQRDKKLQSLKEAFADARAYLKAKKAGTSPALPMDLRWESMIPVLERKIPVTIAADEIQQINAAVAFAEQESLRMVLVGGSDSWRVAQVLREKDIPVLITGTLSLPMRDWEGYDVAFGLAAKLSAAGVRFCIAGDGGASNERNLPYKAGLSSAYGLSKEEALKAVTLYPAQILGVADRLGSLDTGKEATFIITDGDPLDIRTQVLRVFIAGGEIDLRNKHRTLYEKYRLKYERMKEKSE
ncbi:amidohydrolase family protein [candidate division KSB1 bacterium]|nr:amidohydrolase family protein [candidate division KSB1 bacterium]